MRPPSYCTSHIAIHSYSCRHPCSACGSLWLIWHCGAHVPSESTSSMPWIMLHHFPWQEVALSISGFPGTACAPKWRKIGRLSRIQGIGKGEQLLKVASKSHWNGLPHACMQDDAGVFVCACAAISWHWPVRCYLHSDGPGWNWASHVRCCLLALLSLLKLVAMTSPLISWYF